MECNDSRRTQQLPTTWLVCFGAYPSSIARTVHCSQYFPRLPTYFCVVRLYFWHMSARWNRVRCRGLSELSTLWSQSANHFFENFDNPTQLLAVFLGERRDRVCQRFHAAPAAFLEDPGSLRRRFKPHAPPVFGLSPAHQPRARQARHDAAHCWRPDLLRLRQFAQGTRATAQHQNREGRKLRRADAAFAVAHAQPPKEVDGRGMKPVGGLESLAAGETFGLDIRHRI
jgi:hypothetical protein